MNQRSVIGLGVALTALYTLLMASADAITKLVAGGYAPPQLFAISSFLVVLFSVLSSLVFKRGTESARFYRTAAPWHMALRSVATVLAAVGFFYAFRLMPLADVFVFVAMMPILAAVLSGPMLGEPVRPSAWVALAVGATGVIMVVPKGDGGAIAGQGWAVLAAVSGTVSIVLSRRISRFERNDMAQVFFPNLALMVTMGAALPFVWAPMSMVDLGWVSAYAVLLFGARYLVVSALRLLPTYVAMPLMNMQFIWMLALGFLAFGEVPTAVMMTGAVLVLGSGIWVVIDQHLPAHRRAELPVEAGMISEAAVHAPVRSRSWFRTHTSWRRSGSQSQNARQSARH